MAQEWLSRTELLLGSKNMIRLERARVAVFGIGGVGGHVVEALARSGVGALDLIDDDIVVPSNLNRQIIATVSALGRPKVEAARERILEINPDCRVTVHKTFYLPETAAGFDFSMYDYVVDAIDTVTGKLMLAEQAAEAGTPLISSMGAGNKLDPTAFRVADIYETKVCPLAKVMRRELKKRGIRSLKVVYSEESPVAPVMENDSALCAEAAGRSKPESAYVQTVCAEAAGQRKPESAYVLESCMGTADSRDSEAPVGGRRRAPGSIAFVPSVAGLIIAGEVIKDLCASGREAPDG